MEDSGLSSEQLMQELATLRRRVSELEAVDARRQQTEDALRESEAKFAAWSTALCRASSCISSTARCS